MADCCICYDKFSSNSSATDRSHLPVQSRVCAHVLCYSCMIAIYQASPPTYNDDKEEIIAVACPECRLPGAHDPYFPIISLPICALLEEREQMIKKYPDLAPPETPMSSPSSRRERPKDPFSFPADVDPAELADLLTKVAKQKVDHLWNTVQPKLVVEKPLLRLTREASRAVYWGSILLFGKH